MGTIRRFVMMLAAGTALAAAADAQARSQAIVTHENVAISLTAEGKPYTLDQIKRAIIQAASTKAWSGSVQGANTVRATYTRGKHSAVVDIVFSESNYTIKYVDSHDLGYTERDGRTLIHPTYNKAVSTLRQSIDAALRTIT